MRHKIVAVSTQVALGTSEAIHVQRSEVRFSVVDTVWPFSGV